MAKSIKINNVTYSAVPSVEIPLAEGNGNAVFYDTSSADASAAHVLRGHTAYNANGQIEGSLIVPAISQDELTKKLTIV